MKPRFYLFFVFYSLLFLFYPGDTEQFNIFAYNRADFSKKQASQIKLNPVPVQRFFQNPIVTAEGVYVVDLPSFTPVLERNAKRQFFPASTAKVVTALVVYDIYKPEQVITISNTYGSGQVMGLFRGERITVENLLYGLLVHSGNDAAYALAESYGFDKFVDLMNKKAEELHMQNTFFRNPAGIDQSNQHTSAFDLALAARELLKNGYLAKIVSTKEIIVPDVDFKYFHTLTNVNKLLGEIQGIGGLKTGYTEDAGENLVSFYKRTDGHDFVIVILKSEDRFEDTRAIVDWLETNIDYIQIPNF